jgi:gas vesicle protein
MYYSREAEVEAQRNQFVLVLVAAAISLSIGALVALLLAPRKGEEMRRILGEQLDTAVTPVRDLAEHVKKDVEERVHNARS